MLVKGVDDEAGAEVPGRGIVISECPNVVVGITNLHGLHRVSVGTLIIGWSRDDDQQADENTEKRKKVPPEAGI
jgi:hypothetical protein